MQARLIDDKDGTPVRLVRKHKPRNGGGLTLGEFTNRDGRGAERAREYAAQRRHTLVE